MPERDSLEGQLQQGNHWSQAWRNTGNVEGAHSNKGVDQLDPLSDPEANRRKREAANKLYVDTQQPASLQALIEQQQYTVNSPIKITKASAGIASLAPLALAPPRRMISTTPDSNGPKKVAGTEGNPSVVRKATTTPIQEAEIIEATGQADGDNIDFGVEISDEINDAIDGINPNATTPAELNKSNSSMQILTNYMDGLFAQYIAEREKGDSCDMDKLTEIAMRMFAVWHRISSRHDEELSNDMLNALHEHVKKVQGTFNHIGSIISTVASSFLGLLGGLGTMVGGGIQISGGTKIISLATAKTIGTMAGGAGTIGQAFGLPGKHFDEMNGSLRTAATHRKDIHGKNLDDKKQKAQQSANTMKQVINTMESHETQKTRGRKAIMGAEGG